MCVHVCVCTVRHFTTLLYRHNEDDSVPGIISDEKGVWGETTTDDNRIGLYVCVCVSLCGTKDFN